MPARHVRMEGVESRHDLNDDLGPSVVYLTTVQTHIAPLHHRQVGRPVERPRRILQALVQRLGKIWPVQEENGLRDVEGEGELLTILG